MAENKKGFILYADLLHTIKKLPLEKAGELFLHILEYVNDKNPTSNDLIVNIAFEPIKQQLKRDLNRWDDIKTKRAIAGKKGGLAKQANAKIAKQNLANLAVNVNDNVNVSVNVNKDKDISFDLFWDMYDKKVNRPKSERKWKTLTYQTKEKIMQYAPAYKLSQPDKKFRKNPVTFLNNESWEDELINNKTNQNETIIREYYGN